MRARLQSISTRQRGTWARPPRGTEPCSHPSDPGRDRVEATDADDPLRIEHVRASRGGAPEDHAQYTCGCGFVFAADVSTSVHCPHCGCTQAW